MSYYLHLIIESKTNLNFDNYFPEEVLHSVERINWVGHNKRYLCFLNTKGHKFNVEENIDDFLTLCFCMTDLLVNPNIVEVANNRGHVFTIEGVWDLFLEGVRNKSK